MKTALILLLLLTGCTSTGDSLYTFGDLSLKVPWEFFGLPLPLPDIGLQFEFGLATTKKETNDAKSALRDDDDPGLDPAFWLRVFREGQDAGVRGGSGGGGEALLGRGGREGAGDGVGEVGVD